MLILDGINIGGDFLEVKAGGVFTSNLEINTSTRMKRTEMWRYFSAILLTKDLDHLFSVVVFLFFFVSVFERFMGQFCVAICFLFSAILCNFFVGAVIKGNFILKYTQYSNSG